MDLKGKTVLVTGGGTGLGRSIALQFAAAGARLAVNYSRSKDEAEATVAEIRGQGGEAEAFQADVADYGKAEAMLKAVVERFGSLDILINNAGKTKWVPFKDLDGLTEDDWDSIMRLNTMAIFFITRAAAPYLRQAGGGCVINTVSVAGQRPIGSSIAYGVSKAATIHLTRCLAVALGPQIRVNAVAPGFLLTRWSDGLSAEYVANSKNTAVLKKETNVDECASMYIDIARNDSMTGQTVTIDAGLIV